MVVALLWCVGKFEVGKPGCSCYQGGLCGVVIYFSPWNLNDFDWPTSRWRVLRDTPYPSPSVVRLFGRFLGTTPEGERWRVRDFKERDLCSTNQGDHSTHLTKFPPSPMPAKKTKQLSMASFYPGHAQRSFVSANQEIRRIEVTCQRSFVSANQEIRRIEVTWWCRTQDEEHHHLPTFVSFLPAFLLGFLATCVLTDDICFVYKNDATHSSNKN